MSWPILTTKLYTPSPRPELVVRPRLLERLNAGLHHKLTLISAPAGFGKTTLVSDWLASCEREVAWLSLDEADSDPKRFLTYLLAALQTIEASLFAGVMASLASPQSPATETILTMLLNEMDRVENKLIFVLDDYHLVDAKEVDDMLTFLLEHLPSHLHLVITTREDPQLPLPRLRARDQLTELRASDLRFMPHEAADFLNRMMDLSLSAEEVESLESRTEGWVAGLQLAALSVQARDSRSEFIKSFAGDNRYVVDYLVEEVLQRQSREVKDFLLQTSILNQLNASLCDAVSERKNSGDILDKLERGNLFLIPLDDKRQWFRYHHLFAEVLYAHLRQEQEESVAILHGRASAWYEGQGLQADAIHHALAANDTERAADLIECAWAEMDRSLQFATWLRWLKALPEDVVAVRPVLRIGYAWALLDGGELEAGEAELHKLELWLETTSINDMVIADEAQFQALPITIAEAHAYGAQSRGDTKSTVKYMREVLELLPEDEVFRRASATSLLALAQWVRGELAAAHKTFSESMHALTKAGHELMGVVAPFFLADIRQAQGRLGDAKTTCKTALELAEKSGGIVPGMNELHVGLSEVALEQGDITEAETLLLRAKALGEGAVIPGTKYRWFVAMAQVKVAQEDFGAALELLDEAERWFIRTPISNLRSIDAIRARVWLRRGDLDKAQSWLHERGLIPQDELSYLLEFEHITLVRFLIAHYQRGQTLSPLHKANGLLKRLLQPAEAQQRAGSLIELYILQALVHEAQGDSGAGLEPLNQAMTLAEPEGYVRMFIGEGKPMLKLLSEAKTQGVMPGYATKLLATLKDAEFKLEAASSYLPAQSLLEPLSERELEVLRLIAQGFSNREISKRLYRALSTIKGHNRNIFGKLQVQNRTEAVARARELGLL